MTNRRRFVFDTNVLASAALLEGSVAQQALLAALDAGVIALSVDTLNELTEVLQREKFDPYVTLDEREDFLEAVVLAADLVEVTARIAGSRDPNDDKFLELAVHVQADAIVSGDQDLLVLSPFRGIPILKPREFLDRISH